MLNGLYSAAAGMIAQQTRMDGLANDIANVNTIGYKQQRLGFRDLFYNTEQGMRIGAGAAVVDSGRDFASGAFQTGDTLSVAISGPGFLQVRTNDGRIALTRNGDIHLDSSGTFTLASGQRLVPTITLPKGTSPDDVSIAGDGTVTAKGATLGKITLVTVPGQARLQPIGDSLFLPTAASGAPRPVTGGSRLEQGYLEASNVNLADAMVGVIDAQRSFQFDARVITTQDQLMEIANQIRH